MSVMMLHTLCHIPVHVHVPMWYGLTNKHIWLMSAEDTFIYNQLYQLLNKLNNLRHEMLSITIIRKYIYFIIYVSCFRSFIYLS
jgi:hypothetical protein